MSTLRLTQAAVDRLKAPAEGRVEFFDTHLPGFGLRVSAKRGDARGHRAWIVLYRFDGRLRRFTIGTPDTHSIDDARDEARAIQRDAKRGIDRAEVKAKPVAPTRQPDTIASVAGQFIERYAKPKNRSWKETEALLQRHILPRWGDREAKSIGRRDVLELLDDLVDQGYPVAANRVLATVRKMFGWAVERDILAASPVTRISPPGKETERERVLTDEELTRLWQAAAERGGVAGAFFQTLILTGQRRDEVAKMRWRDLDLDAMVWTLPREATKADRTHEVPLAPLVVDVLTALPRTGDYVFSTTRGDRPISGYSKMKAAIAAIAQIENWRIHDLRRTAGTGMARLGIAGSTISRVLNHKEGGVTKIYNRYSYLDEKRHALETWARKVESLVGLVGDNIVPLRA